MHEPSKPPAHVSIVDHTADWALLIRGEDWPALLRHAAEGVSHLLVGDEQVLRPEHTHEFALEAFDAETLLVDWLSELAYLAETEMLVFCDFEVHEANSTSLRATARGSRVKGLAKHIKAVTYHDLRIIDTAEGLEVTVVFDV